MFLLSRILAHLQSVMHTGLMNSADLPANYEQHRWIILEDNCRMLRSNGCRKWPSRNAKRYDRLLLPGRRSRSDSDHCKHHPDLPGQYTLPARATAIPLHFPPSPQTSPFPSDSTSRARFQLGVTCPASNPPLSRSNRAGSGTCCQRPAAILRTWAGDVQWTCRPCCGRAAGMPTCSESR